MAKHHIIFEGMDQLTISVAKERDTPSLLTLVNRAYRGEPARKGWTHEADLIAGDMRIDESSLLGLLKKPYVTILKCVRNESTLVGCVYLEKKVDRLYLGMLSVDPDWQGRGIGNKLLVAAEAHAKQCRCKTIEMTVISRRKELIAWYQSKGFIDSGRREPFHDDGRFGIPVVPLEFLVLVKNMNVS